MIKLIVGIIGIFFFRYLRRQIYIEIGPRTEYMTDKINKIQPKKTIFKGEEIKTIKNSPSVNHNDFWDDIGDSIDVVENRLPIENFQDRSKTLLGTDDNFTSNPFSLLQGSDFIERTNLLNTSTISTIINESSPSEIFFNPEDFNSEFEDFIS